jgi:hypothetical protein
MNSKKVFDAKLFRDRWSCSPIACWVLFPSVQTKEKKRLKRHFRLRFRATETVPDRPHPDRARPTWRQTPRSPDQVCRTLFPIFCVFHILTLYHTRVSSNSCSAKSGWPDEFLKNWPKMLSHFLSRFMVKLNQGIKSPKYICGILLFFLSNCKK